MAIENLTETSITEKLSLEKLSYVNELVRQGKIQLSTDVDGVDVFSAKTAIEIFNIMNSTGYTITDLTDAYGMASWTRELGIKDTMSYIKAIWNDYRVICESEAVPGAWLLSRYLHNERIVIPRVTSRPVEVKDFTFAWYKEVMPWVDPNTDICMQRGSNIDPEFKKTTLKTRGIDYHFEDIPSDAEAIVKASPKTTVILVPWPWNDSYKPISSKIIKLNSQKDYPSLPKLVRAYFVFVDLVAQSY